MRPPSRATFIKRLKEHQRYLMKYYPRFEEAEYSRAYFSDLMMAYDKLIREQIRREQMHEEYLRQAETEGDVFVDEPYDS